MINRSAIPTLVIATSLPLVQPSAGQSGTSMGTGSLITTRYEHTATLLLNGRVLVAGGQEQNGSYLASAELYNSK